jgi:S-adenosylmethionine/arginine decarboxylase-like enzyme
VTTPSDSSPAISLEYEIQALNDPPDDPDVGFGPHLMVDMYGCQPKPCDDPEALHALCHRVTREINMNLLGTPHSYQVGGGDITHSEDSGASAVAVFAESHFTIHGFDKKGFAVADIFSCMPFNPRVVVDTLIQIFQPSRVVARLLYRGEDFPRSD